MIHIARPGSSDPDTLARPHDWEEDAACRRPDVTPAWWQAEPHTHEEKLAKEWCNRACPVRERCLEAALLEEIGLSFRFRAGTRGGLSPFARVRLAGDRRRSR